MMTALNLMLIIITVLIMRSVCEWARCTYISHRGSNNSVHQDSASTCPEHEVCKNTLTISYIDIPPYSRGQLFERIVEGCCGKSCTNFYTLKHYTNISQVRLSHTNSSDFVLPFLGSSSASQLFGYHFIPFIDVPYAYYITPRHASPIARLMKNSVGMYALIILCLFMAVISGFIIWISEMFSDYKCYRPFFPGVFEGFWWSFTVVTSGYGARIVKSMPGKVYTVIWILVGVVMFSLMTSTFTAELMNIMGRHDDSISGGEVGVLKFRDYDASLVVQEGGIILETEAPDFYADLLDLVRMLRMKRVDGILLDKYTLAYARGYLDWKKSNLDTHIDDISKDIKYFLTDTDSTLLPYNGEKLSYGVLVKRHKYYEFLNSAVRDNRLSLETAVESEMNKIFPRKKQGAIIDPDQSVLFWNIVGWIALIIGVICVAGILYEVYHLSRRLKKGKIGSDTICCLVDIVKDHTNQ